ncbi:MAG: DUF1351 domain-containing protein [Lactobacillus kalixensis]|uniref:DUF1351 domain-containing protein n=1 Tax=Lactobacillus kalixensis TaxID=227944 RepID=UPI0039930894
MNKLVKIENEIVFPVEFQPAKVDFSGYDAMKAQIDKLHAGLENYTVTPENLKKSKDDRANLNKLKKAINDRKKEINNQLKEPINQFNSKIKILLNEIDDSYSKINSEIKVFDEKEKAEKHAENLKHIEAMCELAEVDPKDIEYNKSWDTKSYSKTKFETDVDQQIALIKQRQSQYADNVKIIAEHADKLALPSQHWINELKDKPLSRVLSDMDKYKEDLVSIAKSQKETKLKEIRELKKAGDKYIDKSTGEIKEKVITMKLELEGTSWQMKQLQNFLKDNGIKYRGL